MLTVDRPSTSQDASNSTTRKNSLFESYDAPFLLAAFASFVASVALWFLVSHDYGIFVGIWVPSILALWNGVKLSLRKERSDAVSGS